MTVISLGVIGCGWAGRNAHLIPLRTIPEAHVAWVVKSLLEICDVMPELHWVCGYPYALGLMLASTIGLWILFRRIQWL